MKKEYYIRNKKIEVEELTDVLAIKPQGVEKEMNIEEKLGARTKLSGDSRNASRLSNKKYLKRLVISL
jgi:hypothetical protein